MNLEKAVLENLELGSLVDHFTNIEWLFFYIVNEVKQQAKFIFNHVERTLFFCGHSI